jgi:bifunctional non-homologous end joining protein LigD
VASLSVKIGNKKLTVSNIDKVLYPETGFTKGQVIDFYSRVAPFILPHIENRPITLKRYPNGVQGEHFYEKNAPSFTPAWINTYPIQRSSRESMINYVLINDLASLLWSANLANLEIHPFLAKAPDISVPTMIVFDLDPGEGASLVKSCEVAFLLRDLLDRLELESLPKVSGSKGIHVHVPLNTPVTYEMTQAFAQSVAQYLAREQPQSIVSDMAKIKRRGKVFIDWSQNSQHKSTVAVYSLRAKAERPFVAMPVSWPELETALKKNDPSKLFFEPQAALKRLEKTGDLFAPSLRLKQTLPKPFLQLNPETSSAAGDESLAALEPYRRKRDFTKTREPAPSLPTSRPQGGRRLFVIQKHAASHLHYDFRLEMGGTLKSWAVPKGPPYDLHERRLAMATEDHPMDYANFEGIIPAGEYGGGTVMVWDIGSYELIDGNYWKGKLHVLLNGKKLRGEWVLVKGNDRNGKGNVWYLIKAGSEMKRISENRDNSSALTGRNLGQIAKAEDAVWHSNRTAAQEISPGNGDGTSNLELPEIRIKFIEPMLSEIVDELPEDSDLWSFEIKLDGYRCLALRDESGVKLYSRKKNLLNSRFPTIVKALERFEPGIIFDGEIVALDDNGRPAFNLLQNFRFTAKQIHFYAFDLLAERNKNLMGLALEKRRELLAIRLEDVADPIRFSESIDGSPQDIVAAAKELSLEGIIAKRKDSVYQPGKRGRAWLKYKINKVQPFVVGGYTPGHPFDALIVGYYEDDSLLYAAKVRNGFVPRVRREVAQKFAGLEKNSCPFANLPEKRRTQWALTREELKNCVWLKPRLIVQIEFVEWTPDKHLRAAKFVGLRDDKDAREIVREASLAPI